MPVCHIRSLAELLERILFNRVVIKTKVLFRLNVELYALRMSVGENSLNRLSIKKKKRQEKGKRHPRRFT